jgi:hypothetical protein
LSASVLFMILLTCLPLPVFFVFLCFPKWELVLYQMMFTMELFMCLFSNWAPLLSILYTIAMLLESCQIAPTPVYSWFHKRLGFYVGLPGLQQLFSFTWLLFASCFVSSSLPQLAWQMTVCWISS